MLEETKSEITFSRFTFGWGARDKASEMSKFKLVSKLPDEMDSMYIELAETKYKISLFLICSGLRALFLRQRWTDELSAIETL